MLPPPPCHVIDDFLDRPLHDALLEWTLASRVRFKPAKVGPRGVGGIARGTRSNLRLRDLGPVDGAVRAALLAALPTLAAGLGCAVPERPSLELEITAYGDGDFYHAHIDTFTGTGGPDTGAPRTISAVYYFHRLPKAFAGGALRLLPWEGETVTDIEPVDNRLAAFLSWARHEVLPISSPSNRFEDSRFALNCWFCA